MATSPINSYAPIAPASRPVADAAQRRQHGTDQGAGFDSQATVVTLSPAARASIAPVADVKDFATVAREARAALDANASNPGAAIASLDRRSLYAIASNAGKQFSGIEQGQASIRMLGQQTEAMEISPESSPAEIAEGYRRGIAFLDAVSAEEKSSFTWARQRAATQFGYESHSRRAGLEPDALDSSDPVARLIKSGMDALNSTNDPSKRLEDMPQYVQAEWTHAARQGAVRIVDRLA